MPDYVQYFTKPIIEIFWNSSMNLKINSLFKNQKNETEKRIIMGEKVSIEPVTSGTTSSNLIYL